MSAKSSELRKVWKWRKAVQARGLWICATTHFSGHQYRWRTGYPRPAMDWGNLPDPEEILEQYDDIVIYRPVASQEEHDIEIDRIDLEVIDPVTDQFGNRLLWDDEPVLEGDTGLVLAAFDDETDWVNPLVEDMLGELEIEVESLREFFEALAIEHPSLVAETTTTEVSLNVSTECQTFFTTNVPLSDPAWEEALLGSTG